MKIGRPPICESANLFVWLALLAFQSAGWAVDGLASCYLPLSLVLLLTRQLWRSSRPAFDISIVFLLSCLFFFCVSLILWPFSSFSPTEFSSLVIVTFSWQQLDAAAIWVGLSIAISMMTMMLLQHDGGQRTDRLMSDQFVSEYFRYKGLYRFGVFCIAISLPAVTLESFDQLRFIQAAGYLALYSDGLSVSAASKAFFYIFDLGFGIIVAFARTKTQFLVPAILFLIIATIDSLKGVRGAILVPLLFVAWFYIARFNIRVRVLPILRNLAIITVIFSVMSIQRHDDQISSGVLQFVIDALSTQGRSLQLTALYQTVADEVAKYGNYTVLSNLLMPITAVIHPEIRGGVQSLDLVMHSNNLKHILTYVLNDSYYFSGGGTGGVYTIELLEAGLLFYVLLSMGLGWFLAWMPASMHKPWVRYLSIYFFSAVFYMPRGEFFFNTLIVGKALFLYLVVVGMHGIYKRCKHVKRHDLEMSLPGTEARA